MPPRGILGRGVGAPPGGCQCRGGGGWGQRSQWGRRSQFWGVAFGARGERIRLGVTGWGQGRGLGSEVTAGSEVTDLVGVFGVRGHKVGGRRSAVGVRGQEWRSQCRGNSLGSEVTVQEWCLGSEVTVGGQRSPFGVRGHNVRSEVGVRLWGEVPCHRVGSEVTEWGQRSQWEQRSEAGVRGQRSEVTAVGYVASGGAPGGSSTSCSDGSRYSATAGTETPTLGPTAPHNRPPDPQPHRLYGAGPPPTPPRCSKCSSSPTTAPSAP